MIEKKEESSLTPDAELLSQTCQYLESRVLQVQSDVRSTFARLTDVLQSRERQLLRQIDVAHNQQLAFIHAKAENAICERVPVLEVEMESENAVKEALLSLGTVSLQGNGLIMLNGDGTFLQSLEDYQDAIEDHVAMFKPVPHDLSASPKSQETIIRFNRINLPSHFTSDAEILTSPNTSGECDFLPGLARQLDINHGEERIANIPSSIQTTEHPAQVQQWLKQLSAETETEPSVGEPKNFGPA